MQTTTFEYGVLGELEQVEFPDGRTIEYEHDSMRRRIARKVEGTYTHRFIYGSNINPIAEVDANGDIRRRRLGFFDRTTGRYHRCRGGRFSKRH